MNKLGNQSIGRIGVRNWFCRLQQVCDVATPTNHAYLVM